MTFIGNILWFAFGGIWLGLSWGVAGLLCCCTIVGIPFGVACFRIAGFSFCPFGKNLFRLVMLVLERPSSISFGSCLRVSGWRSARHYWALPIV